MGRGGREEASWKVRQGRGGVNREGGWVVVGSRSRVRGKRVRVGEGK